MTDEFGFEPLDDELGRRLRDAAPPAGDAGVALASLRPRFERARQRRRAVVGGGTVLAGIAAIALMVAVVAPGSGTDVRTPPATQPHITTTLPTVPTTTAAVPGGTGPGATTATSDNHGGNRGPGGSGSGDSGSGSSSSGSGSSGSSSSGNGG